MLKIICATCCHTMDIPKERPPQRVRFNGFSASVTIRSLEPEPKFLCDRCGGVMMPYQNSMNRN